MDTKKQIINFNLLFTAAVNKNNNDSLEQNAKIALILEKLCNEDLITKKFLDSITMSDIDDAKELIFQEQSLTINEMQKNTFLEELILKRKCIKTNDTEDFF